MNRASFTHASQGAPPWEIGRPQPAVVTLAEQGLLAGRILDVGCGTGENSLHLASLGHTVLGLDGVAAAIESARAKASQRGLTTEFVVGDGLDLAVLKQQFDAVLDSAFLHVLQDTAMRRAYTSQLAGVVPAGGSVHLLQISERVTGPYPNLTTTEIVEAFDHRWSVEDVRETRYLISSGEVPAWLVNVRRR